MKHSYKEKCDVCGQWSNYYQSHKTPDGFMLICDKCYDTCNGRFDLEMPRQLTIDEKGEVSDAIFNDQSKKRNNRKNNLL